MSEDVASLFRKHDAFYEVSGYYAAVAGRRVQAGFDVDVYAPRTDHTAPFMPRPDLYAQGAAALEGIVKRAEQDAAGASCVESFAFPSSVTFGVRGHAGEPAAMFRIRVSVPLLDRPAGASESDALAHIERHLRELGIARR